MFIKVVQNNRYTEKMHLQLKSCSNLLALLLSALLLASCGSAPYRPSAKVESRDVLTTAPDPTNEIEVDTPTLDNRSLKVEDLKVSRGEYFELQSKNARDSVERVNGALNAGENYIQGKDFERAERAVSNLYGENLDQTQIDRLTIITAYVRFNPIPTTLSRPM